MPAILRRLRQENHKSEVSLVYRANMMSVLDTSSPCFKKKKRENVIFLNKNYRHYKIQPQQFRATA